MSMAQRAVDRYQSKTYGVKKRLEDQYRDMPRATMFVISNAGKS